MPVKGKYQAKAAKELDDNNNIHIALKEGSTCTANALFSVQKKKHAPLQSLAHHKSSLLRLADSCLVPEADAHHPWQLLRQQSGLRDLGNMLECHLQVISHIVGVSLLCSIDWLLTTRQIIVAQETVRNCQQRQKLGCSSHTD